MKTAIVALYPYQSGGLDYWLDHGAGMTYTAVTEAGIDVDFVDMKALKDDAELTYKLRGYDLVAFGLKSSYYPIATRVVRIAKSLGCRVLVGGYHATAAPQELLDNPDIDWVLRGESEITFPEFLRCPEQFPRDIWGEMPPDLDLLPFMRRDMYLRPLEPVSGWWYGGKHHWMASVVSARGCPYHCLAGDTPIHTIDGVFPIKELVGKENVKILSRNPVTQEPVYAPAIHIRKTQEMAELVRVHFDDGSYVDCTPDHRFKVFKSKNQFIEESERDVEAKDLKPKQQVRAICFDVNKKGRVSVSTRRDIVRYHARIVMESLLGRPLEMHERVHHKDRQKGNDSPGNLVLTDANNHIPDCHPEVSQRMIENNPAKNMTPEWRKNVRQAVTGKKRTLEQRLRYRESKLGRKNPMYKEKPRRRRPYASRIEEVNHKVVRIEKLPCREDVYCMEIPGINWFYANKVLVHNCAFCQPLEFNHFGPKVRRRSVESVVKELLALKWQYHPDSVLIHDDTFLIEPKWLEEFVREYPRVGLPFWAAGRADGICKHPDLVRRLVGVGWDLISVGFESGSQRILDIMEKGTTVEQNLEAARIIKSCGAKIYANYILGLPWETRQDVQATMRMADTIAAEMPSWAYFAPYPGCKLGEQCIREGLSLLNKDTYDRYPGGVKCRGVDYAYLNACMKGLRE